MKIHARLLILVVAVVLAIGVYIFALNRSGGIQLRAAGVAWDGGGDGVSWEDPLNWDNDSVPTAVDDVEIDANVTVEINEGTTINSLDLGNAGGTTSPTLVFAYDAVGDELVLDDGALRVYTNATITHSAGTNVIVGRIAIDVQNSSAIIEGTINVNGRGYASSEGPGAGGDSTVGAGGGSHGGVGGIGGDTMTGPPGAVNGVITAPITLGSGGGNASTAGGAGGGSVRLWVSTTLTVGASGTITANGSLTNNLNAGGGAGGSIYLDVGTLAGSGLITAHGGAGQGSVAAHPGSGGGGRIAVYYDTLTMSNANIRAYGGRHASVPHSIGGAGTILLRDNGDSASDLIIDNNNELGPTRDDRYIGRTPLTPSATPLSITLNDLIIRNRGNLDLNSSTTIAYSTISWSDSGIITDNGGSLPLLNANASVTIPTNAILFANTTKSWNGLLVNGTLTHSNNRTTAAGEMYKININVENAINIAAGGVVDVSERGYMEMNGPGAGASNGGGSGGGSHGGRGGTGDDDFDGASGPIYGSISDPHAIGSGGGTPIASTSVTGGGRGGGAVRLVAGTTLTVDGPISANGISVSQNGWGGGAGGSVSLAGATVAGSAIVSANGGHGDDGTTSHPGSGGGGRIAVAFDTLTLSSANLRAYGGSDSVSVWSTGGAGTIYLDDSSETHPSLIIDNNGNFGDLNDDRYMGRTPLTEGSPLSITFDTITLRNAGNLDVNSNTTISYTTLNWDDDGILTDNGGTFSLLSGGGVLTVPLGATLYANTTRSYTGVLVEGRMTHSNNSTTAAGQVYDIDITSSGYITVAATGTVDVDERGYMESHGPGGGTTNIGGAGGGSHGGSGGIGDNDFDGQAGPVYGAVATPTTIGSGGGMQVATTSVVNGGRGGGAVRLTADGTLTVNGAISANGRAAGQNDWGGGAGGSVFLTGATVAGTAIVSVNGGDGGSSSTSHPGSGGGGRIAIAYDTLTLSNANFRAYGGSNATSPWSTGGAGTIYLDDSSETHPSLIIDNNGEFGDLNDDRYTGRTPLTEGSPLSITFDTITLRNAGNLDVNSDTTINYTSFNWSDDGVLTDNGGTFSLLSGGGVLTVPSGATLYANTARSYTGVLVQGRLTHSNNSTTAAGQVYDIDITSSDYITISSTGIIDADERGYMETQGPGASATNAVGTGGASHGGVGGVGRADGLGLPGVVYGSLTTPATIGSGSGTQTGATSVVLGSRGGGAVRLVADGTLLVNGPISANATPSHGGSAAGGGSGGSVYLNAGTVSGSSIVEANGGAGQESSTPHPGSGGGGRIAIYYDTLTFSTTNAHAYGGVQTGFDISHGGAGTIFVKDNAATYGDLIIDNDNTTFSNNDDRFIGRTRLTAIGSPLILTVDELIIRNQGNLELNSDTSLTYSQLVWTNGVVTDGGGVAAGLTSGALTIPNGGTFLANTARTYSSVTVHGRLSHSRNESAETYKINMTINGNFTLSNGAAIDVTNTGYSSTFGPGAGEDDGNWGSGAGHGGEGGPSSDAGSAGGTTYGSGTAPVTLGSGGGNDGAALGGAGGGAVRLTIAGDMSLLGTVEANAGSATGADGGGGSGGSVLFDVAGAMTGSGTIEAEGGSGQEANAGAGGGGRVRVECDDGTGWTPNVSVIPGTLGNTAYGGTFSDQCSAEEGGGGGGDGPDITAEVENEAPLILTGTEKLCDNTSSIADSHAAIAGCSNVSVVNLVAGSTLPVTLFVQVRDENGESDIASSGHTGVYYHNVNASPTNETCTVDNNDCYALIGTKSAVINSTDAWIRYNFNLHYYADSSMPAGNWVGYVEVVDNSTATDDNGGDEYTNEVNSIVSITFPDVVFGAITLPFTSSDTNNIEIDHQNNGNVLVDVNINLDGGQMTCGAGSIPASSIKFDPASDVAYSSMLKTLTASPTNVEMDIEVEQRVNDVAPQSGVDIKTSYWGLSVASGISGACTGTLNVTAFEGP